MSTRQVTDEQCDHQRLECPEHNGSFDCNSFCSTCEGNQEYCPDGCIMTLDDEGYLVYVKEKSN